ncbi:MAG: ATP-binding protein [bacterium]
MEEGKGCVLIVDDEEAYRKSLKVVLKAGGYNVHLTENSQGALKSLEENPVLYRLIIVDWHLGKGSMDGIELTREIKVKYPEVKVIQLTQFGNKELYDKALEAGAVRFIHKTDDPREIIEILDSLAEMEELDFQLRKPTPENYWLHQIITECKSGISIIDRTYRVLFISNSLRRMFPYELKVGGICWVEFHHNETQKEPCPFCPLRSWFEIGEPSPRGNTELSPVGEGKELQYFDITGSPIRNKEGRIIGGVKIFTDVTERERFIQTTGEVEIRKELKEQLRIVLEGIQRLGNYDRLRVYSLSEDMNRLEGLVKITGIEADLDYSKEVELLCGLAPDKHRWYCEHITGENILLCNSNEVEQHPLYPELKEWLLVLLIAESEPIGIIEIDNEESKRHLSGYDSDLILKYAGHAARSIAVAMEIQEIRDRAEKIEKLNEELKKAQAELIQAEKLTVTGTLLFTVAHQLKNPLNNLSLSMYSLNRLLPDKSPEVEERIKNIEMEIDRSIKIIKNFLDFARPSEVARREENINLILEQTLNLLKDSALFKDIKIETRFTTLLPKVIVDPDPMKEVFLNIVLNAQEAMSKGGVLTVTTDIIPDEKGVISVTFSDTGDGISPEKIKDIFNPFYTTKQKGMGMGLSIAQRIIHEHGGTIRVESVPGKGTTFNIRLPIKKEE